MSLPSARPWLVPAAILALGGVLLALWPEVDLWIAGGFRWQPPGEAERFLGNSPGWRTAIKGMQQAQLVLAALVGLWLVRNHFVLRYRRLRSRILTGACLASLVLGPLVLVNWILKAHLGRARPAQLELWGGELQFSPAFVPSDQCASNCSFVSGDVSMSVWLVCAVVPLLPRIWRRRAVWIGCGLVGYTALLRMVGGAHFASDVLMAASLILLVHAGCLIGITRRVRGSRR